MVMNSAGKNSQGIGCIFKAPLSGVIYGITVPTAIPIVVRIVSCHEARLRIKGNRGVLIMCMTSVCDHKLSTNQPAWNRATKPNKGAAAACIAASDAPELSNALYVPNRD